jgi:hypothetical protein
MSKEPDPSAGLEALAKGLAGTLAAGGAALGLFGIKEGTLTRIILNRGNLLVLALLIVVGGVVLAILAVEAARRNARARSLALDVLAVVLFLFGTLWIGTLAVDTAGENERPRIAAKLTIGPDGTPILEATVTAEGLRTNEHALITVLGRSTRAALLQDRTGRAGPIRVAEADEPQRIGLPSQLLFATRAGPDRDGKVDRSFTIPLTAGIYDVIDVQAFIEEPRSPEEPLPIRVCDEASRTYGCLSIWLPQISISPQLSVSWEPAATGTPILTITVKKGSLPPEAGAWIDIRGRHHNRWSPPFYSSSLSPVGAGTLDSTIKVPVVRPFAKVCVVATLVDPILSSDAAASPSRPKTCRSIGAGQAAASVVIAAADPGAK